MSVRDPVGYFVATLYVGSHAIGEVIDEANGEIFAACSCGWRGPTNPRDVFADRNEHAMDLFRLAVEIVNPAPHPVEEG